MFPEIYQFTVENNGNISISTAQFYRRTFYPYNLDIKKNEIQILILHLMIKNSTFKCLRKASGFIDIKKENNSQSFASLVHIYAQGSLAL